MESRPTVMVPPSAPNGSQLLEWVNHPLARDNTESPNAAGLCRKGPRRPGTSVPSLEPEAASDRAGFRERESLDRRCSLHPNVTLSRARRLRTANQRRRGMAIRPPRRVR
jgi:hypothetical protein